MSMDSLNGNSGTGSTKAQQLKPPRGSLSPMELPAQNIFIGGQYPQQYHHSNFPILDPYASPNSKQGSPSSNSPFVNLFHRSSGRSSSGSGSSWGSGSGSSGSGAGGHVSPMPLNSIENSEMPFSRSPTVFKTPVKIQEDVLVMDGIVVNSEQYRKSKGSAGQKTRSPLFSSSSAGRLSFSSSSSSSSSSRKENRCSYKMEKCRSWDDFGTCRFGSKCQFVHAMGELHAKNDLGNNKSEYSPQEMIWQPVGSGSCIDANMPRLDLHVTKASPLFGRSPPANIKSVEVGPVSPSTTDNVYELNTWYPLDDGIQASLPSASSDLGSSRAAFNAHVDSVLYGFSGRKRLSAFSVFCPNKRPVS